MEDTAFIEIEFVKFIGLGIGMSGFGIYFVIPFFQMDVCKKTTNNRWFRFVR